MGDELPYPDRLVLIGLARSLRRHPLEHPATIAKRQQPMTARMQRQHDHSTPPVPIDPSPGARPSRRHPRTTATHPVRS